MRLLRRRKPVRSGIKRVPDRKLPAHLAYVRGFVCILHELGQCDGPVQAAHMDAEVPYEDQGGTGLKSRDIWTLPLCSRHHGEYQDRHHQFEDKYNVRIKWICESLARQSPSLRRAEREDR